MLMSHYTVSERRVLLIMLPTPDKTATFPMVLYGCRLSAVMEDDEKTSVLLEHSDDDGIGGDDYVNVYSQKSSDVLNTNDLRLTGRNRLCR